MIGHFRTTWLYKQGGKVVYMHFNTNFSKLKRFYLQEIRKFIQLSTENYLICIHSIFTDVFWRGVKDDLKEQLNEWRII